MTPTQDPSINIPKTSPEKLTEGTLDAAKSRHSLTIGRPREEIFQFWRQFDNLPQFMKDLEDVTILSSRRSHWTVRMKSGTSAEWDAEITAEIPGQLISWKSVEGSSVETEGTVSFEEAPAGLGTVVRLSMDYGVPGGKLTEWISFLRGEDPDTLAITNLKRLKQYLETGEVATTQGQPSGREADAEDATPTKH